MKTKLLVLALLTGGSMFAETRFSVGVNVGGHGPGYYAPAVPPSPAPGYTWVDGYWSADRGQRAWVNGYWARPRFEDRRYHDPFDGRDRYDRDRNDDYRRR